MKEKNEKKLLQELFELYSANNSSSDLHLLTAVYDGVKPTNWTVLMVVSGTVSVSYEILGENYRLSLSAGEALVSCRGVTVSFASSDAQYSKTNLSVKLLFSTLFSGMEPVYDHYTEISSALNVEIKQIFESLCRELPFDAQNYRKLQFQQLTILIKCLLKDGANKSKYTDSHRKIIAVSQYIHSNLESQVTRTAVAERFGLNSHTMNRQLQKYYNQGFKEMLLESRLSNAMTLLKQTVMKVAEISGKCGFNNPEHFIYQFRRRYGITPLSFRKAVKSDLFSLLSLKELADLKPVSAFSPAKIADFLNRKSVAGQKLSSLTVVNFNKSPVNFYWINEEREPVHYGTVLPGEWLKFNSYVGQVWLLRDSNQQGIAAYRCESAPGIVKV